jgi:phospholipid transport system substrate-binding protein
MKRRSFLTLAASGLLAVSLNAGSALAASPEAAKAMVETVSVRLIDLIKQPGTPQSKVGPLKSLMEANVDVRQVAGFALGRYARGTTPDQRDRYVAAYSDYIARTYADRFSEYGGETIRVTGAQDFGRKGVFVSSEVNYNGQPVTIGWQVQNDRSGQMKIVDINVDGLSMAESQRADFTRMIADMGGDVDAFISRLQSL